MPRMLLVSAKVGPFKSINLPQTVAIGEKVTVLVGMNESGKTVFLQSLERSVDALALAEFDPVEDYPRKDLSAYLKRHKENPEVATVLTYHPTKAEIDAINKKLFTHIKAGFTFYVNHDYANASIGCHVDEKPVFTHSLPTRRLAQTQSRRSRTPIRCAASPRP
jgi:hypothetical protein